MLPASFIQKGVLHQPTNQSLTPQGPCQPLGEPSSLSFFANMGLLKPESGLTSRSMRVVSPGAADSRNKSVDESLVPNTAGYWSGLKMCIYQYLCKLLPKLLTVPH